MPRRSRTNGENLALADMMKRHVSQFSEHFTSIQITGTKLESDGSTTTFHSGSGDIHARIHAAMMWIDMAEDAIRPD